MAERLTYKGQAMQEALAERMPGVLENDLLQLDRQPSKDSPERIFVDSTIATRSEPTVLWQNPKQAVTKEVISTHITKARDGLMREESERTKSAATYNLDFDKVAYKALGEFALGNREVYHAARLELNAYTTFQLQTLLGERYHTGLSKYSYRIEDGQIYPEGATEPFLNMLERGRDYRKLHGSKDTLREDAEVVGFQKIQEVLCGDETPTGTMMVSISPRGVKGSIYQHNFYDVFTKKEKDGKSYIEARRYSSALDTKESLEKARQIDELFGEGENVSDAYFLANPLRVSPTDTQFKTPDDLHAFLHTEHQAMNEEDFSEIIRICTPLIMYYINALTEDPDNDSLQKLSFNALLNKADEVADRLEAQEETIFMSTRNVSHRDIRTLGYMTVRAVDTGCGLSGGFAMGGNELFGGPLGPFSVLAFGAREDKYGSLEFDCPACKKKNVRPFGELLKNCQHCNSTKVSCED